MASSNSTLNVINIEIAELKAKQLKAPLGIIDMKKLESLIRMKKDLSNTKDFDEYEQIDEDIFTDEEIEEFLAARKANEEKAIKKTTTAAVKKEAKANKKTTKKVSKG